MEMIKLIVFDLWQTLAYRSIGYSTTSRMLEVTGVGIPKERFLKIFEESLQTRKWKSRQEAYGRLARNMGLSPTKKNVGLLMGIRDRAEDTTKLYPHTIPMLKQLRQQGYRTGLLSNSSIFAVEQIRKRTSLLRYIDYPLFSFDVGVIKPDLRFYREMLRMSRFRPKETIMVGDKEGDDIIPAKRLGMNAILFRDYEHLKRDLAGFGIAIR
jgi:HAD superfamily hydrolase (TIGR01662 family)